MGRLVNHLSRSFEQALPFISVLGSAAVLLPGGVHLLHSGAGGFAEGGDAVDRADALVADSAGLRSQPSVGGTCRDC